MNTKENFEIITKLASIEKIPVTDVADRVVAILQRHRQAQISDKPLMWVAAISSATAVPAAVTAIIMYMWSSPLAELVKSISWVTQ